MKINVVKAFRLKLDDATNRDFAVGEHDVEKEIAEHWYVQAHTDKAPPPRLVPGTPQYAAAARAKVAEELAAKQAAEAGETAPVDVPTPTQAPGTDKQPVQGKVAGKSTK